MDKRLIDADTYLLALRNSNYQCGYCGIGLDDKNAIANLKTPRALGGQVQLENIIAACKSCDKLKAHMDIEEFRAFIFQKVSDDIDKAFLTLDKLNYLMDMGDVEELELSLANTKILIKQKIKRREVIFHFEKVEDFKENGRPSSSGNVTVRSLQ